VPDLAEASGAKKEFPVQELLARLMFSQLSIALVAFDRSIRI
jgi:hypothetical protein